MARRLPPLNALRAFEAAARTGSFKQAAAELHVSASAISHQVALLESVLSARLFSRAPHSIELTASGRDLYPYLQRAFDLLHEGASAFLRPTGDNTLTIRVYSTFAVRWLIPRLHDFQSRFPHFGTRVTTAQTDPTFDASEDIDVAIVIGRPAKGAMHYDYLFSPTLFPVCSPRLLRERPITCPADLRNHTLLQVYPSASDWSAWLRATGTKKIDPDAGLSFDSYDHALRMAARGVGIALAMQPYVGEDLAAGHLVMPLPKHVVSAAESWHLAYREEDAAHGKVEAFRTWLLEAIQADPELKTLRRKRPASGAPR